MRKIRKIGYLIFLSLLLTSCTSATKMPYSTVSAEMESEQPPFISYAELFQHPECSLPCWNGIEVDETSLKSAKDILINK